MAYDMIFPICFSTPDVIFAWCNMWNGHAHSHILNNYICICLDCALNWVFNYKFYEWKLKRVFFGRKLWGKCSGKLKKKFKKTYKNFKCF